MEDEVTHYHSETDSIMIRAVVEVLYIYIYIYVCVCVRERERERYYILKYFLSINCFLMGLYDIIDIIHMQTNSIVSIQL